MIKFKGKAAVTFDDSPEMSGEINIEPIIEKTSGDPIHDTIVRLKSITQGMTSCLETIQLLCDEQIKIYHGEESMYSTLNTKELAVLLSNTAEATRKWAYREIEKIEPTKDTPKRRLKMDIEEITTKHRSVIFETELSNEEIETFIENHVDDTGLNFLQIVPLFEIHGLHIPSDWTQSGTYVECRCTDFEEVEDENA